MTEQEAVSLIGGERLGEVPETWADLGCGDGTFTRALATLLPGHSVIHAMDRDVSALRHIPDAHAGVSIVTHAGDFTKFPWPFEGANGVMLANALHYVRDQAAFIRECAVKAHVPRFLIVEYDTDRSNPWVPYPLSQAAMLTLFADAGYPATSVLATRRSRYQRAQMYSALIDRRAT